MNKIKEKINYSSPKEGEWVFVHPQNTIGKIIEKSCLWGNPVFRVWLPSSDSIIRVTPSSLSSTGSSTLTTHHLIYLATAARIADALTQDVLLAPIESSVIPLSHQIRALSRAISSDRVRYLLADEVGLGKTVVAGLIMRELKLRGLVRRTLVIAPRGRERVQLYIIRTEKRQAIDAEGESILNPDAQNWISYILMQRLVVSSTRAIRTTLEHGLEILKSRPQLLSLLTEFENKSSN